VLPRFNDHKSNAKNRPLENARAGEPELVVRRFLDDVTVGRSRADIRVLDVGCGRGSRVAWLLENGWQAWGCDVAPEYVEASRSLFQQRGWGDDRIRTIDGPGLPFDPQMFDVVLSDQVIEHVEDLEQFVRNLATVSALGSVGFHAFPATWRPMEPHLRAPLVHWAPKGRWRRLAIKTALRLGKAADYFADDHSLDERTTIFTTYSETQTFYRSRREVRRLFERAGMSVDMATPSRDKVRLKLPQLPAAILPLAGELHSRVAVTYVRTRLH
jgi:SAM-dependent methyltransferase